MKSSKKTKEYGITLVALVITIIVLLILAGVTLNLTLGENGLLRRAEESVNAHEKGKDNDVNLMEQAYDYMNQYFDGNQEIPTYTTKLTELEIQALENNGIKELEPNEIVNENLKNNKNIKGVITGEVPVPTGFSYKEGTKDTGAVITDGESEFVWVPVSEISEMAVLQAGNIEDYQGVLYDFSGTTATKRALATIGSGSGYREPDVLTSSSYDAKTSNLEIINSILGTSYETVEQFKTVLQKDFNNMVESVIKYKGFFIGRYETSIDLATKRAYSKVGVLPATMKVDSANTWYGMYAYQKKMAETNGYTSVESHMVWGSNYDAMLRWALTGNDAGKVTKTGNAAHNLSAIYETGKETVTGKADRINNVYDLEGNGYEWTAGTYANEGRMARGGNYDPNWGTIPSYLGYSQPTGTLSYYCSRPILYLK